MHALVTLIHLCAVCIPYAQQLQPLPQSWKGLVVLTLPLAIVTQAEALANLLNGSGVCTFLGCAAPPTAGEVQWRRLANVAGLTGSVCSYGGGSAGGGSASCVTSGPPYAASLRSGVVSVLSPDGFMQTTSLSDAAVVQGTRAGDAGWSASQMGNLALDNTWCVSVGCVICNILCLLSACVDCCVHYFSHNLDFN